MSSENNSSASGSPVVLHLREFFSGGSKYINCVDDAQRPLLSHILNGAVACFFAEELPTVQAVANAHGWIVRLELRTHSSWTPD